MATTQSAIINVLRVLRHSEGVTVEVSTRKGTVNVKHGAERSPDFRFRWSTDHFIGCFVDSDGHESQAVVSLWEPIDAVNFVTAYGLLVQLRAGRR